MSKWYVGAMNDAIFIIDKPPSPSGTDVVWKGHDDVNVIAGPLPDVKDAERIVKTHNALLEVIEAARHWVKHECDGDCMAECFWRDATGEALERLDDTSTEREAK